MTAMTRIRYFMLTLLAALTLGLGGMAHAGAGDAGSGDGASDQDTGSTIQFEDDEGGGDDSSDDEDGGDGGDSDW